MQKDQLLKPNLVRSVGSFISYDVIDAVTSIVLIPLLITYLGEGQYGLRAAVYSLLGYVALFDLGLGQTVTKFVAQHFAKDEEKELNAVISTAFVLYLAMFAASFLIFAALSPFLTSILKLPPELSGEFLATAKTFYLFVVLF